MKEEQVERILFATDYLESSRLALDYAVALAHHFKATLVMLHVAELPGAAHEAEVTMDRPSVSREEAEERLDAFAAGARRASVTVETCIRDGFASEVILAAIGNQRADLLVLGTHGIHRGLSHLLIGSNVEKILLSATCPTLTVGAHVLGGIDRDLHLRELLYYSDSADDVMPPVSFAHFLADAFHVPLEICRLTLEQDGDKSSPTEQLAALRSDVRNTNLLVKDSPLSRPIFEVDREERFKQILRRAKTQTAGLIMLGVHRESFLERHMHTSLAYQLLAEASCPVVTIKVSSS